MGRQLILLYPHNNYLKQLNHLPPPLTKKADKILNGVEEYPKILPESRILLVLKFWFTMFSLSYIFPSTFMNRISPILSKFKEISNKSKKLVYFNKKGLQREKVMCTICLHRLGVLQREARQGLGFRSSRYLIDILYTNTLLMNLSNSSWSQKLIKLKSLILAQIERWWYA